MTVKTPIVLSATGGFQLLQPGDTLAPSAAAGVTIYQRLSGTVAVQSGTSTINYGTTAPTTSNGTQIASVTITPSAIGSVMEIMFNYISQCSTSNKTVTVALFRGNTFIGYCTNNTNNNRANPGLLRVLDTTTSLSPITYTLRIGADTGSSWYLGCGSVAIFGGATSSSCWSITEYES